MENDSTEQTYEHLRIHRLMENLDNSSIKIFWAFVLFWALLAVGAIWWAYEYIYEPVSKIWN